MYQQGEDRKGPGEVRRMQARTEFPDSWYVRYLEEELDFDVKNSWTAIFQVSMHLETATTLMEGTRSAFVVDPTAPSSSNFV